MPDADIEALIRLNTLVADPDEQICRARHDGARARAHRQHLLDHRLDRLQRALGLCRDQGLAGRLHPIAGARSRPLGVTVNAIAPGFIDTEMTTGPRRRGPRARRRAQRAEAPRRTRGRRRGGRVPDGRGAAQHHRRGADRGRRIDGLRHLTGALRRTSRPRYDAREANAKQRPRLAMRMPKDAQGLTITGSARFGRAFDRAIADYWGLTGDPVGHLESARLREDPGFALGATRDRGAVSWLADFRGDSPGSGRARSGRARNVGGRDERERKHLAAVEAWAEGRSFRGRRVAGKTFSSMIPATRWRCASCRTPISSSASPSPSATRWRA